MSAKVTIECDAFGCNNEIDNNGATDDVKELIEWNNWHKDPTTDEYHYCPTCWPAVEAEYKEVE